MSGSPFEFRFISISSRSQDVLRDIFFVAALSLSLLLGRETAFRSRLHHQRPFWFSEKRLNVRVEYGFLQTFVVNGRGRKIPLNSTKDIF